MSLLWKPATLLAIATLVALAIVTKTQPEFSRALVYVQLPFALGSLFLCASMLRQEFSGLAVGAFLWGIAVTGLFAIGSVQEALRISFTTWD